MKNTVIFIACLLCISTITAQGYETDQMAKNQVKKLDFLTGTWKGSGWKMNPNGQKYNFDQTEKVSFKLDSTAILFEGKGITAGKVFHNAMAVVTYDKENGDYDFQSFLQNGRKGDFHGELKNTIFYWYPDDRTRYMISLNEKGQWYETGEYFHDEKWTQFFEMTLDKI